MNSIEFIKRIEKFIQSEEEHSNFIAIIENLSKSAAQANEFTYSLIAATRGGNKENILSSASKLNHQLVSSRNLLLGISQRKFFAALDGFENALIELSTGTHLHNWVRRELITRIEKVSSYYDNFIHDRAPDSAFQLLTSANQLKEKIDALEDILSAAKETLQKEEFHEEFESNLDLQLPGHLTLGDFGERLSALQSIYSELCMLLNIPEASIPVRIAKIESGSLWANLFGESRVIGLIVTFIENATEWTYRNYTKEGKLTDLPRKVETIESILDLRKKLNEMGLDTKDMDENIKKASVALSEHLSTLIKDQPSVRVNDVMISLPEEAQKALMQTGSVQRLESPSRHRGSTP